MRIEGEQALARLVHLDQMAEVGSRVAHHEPLTSTSRRVEGDGPASIGTVPDSTFQGVDQEREMVHAGRGPDPFALMLDDQFDHQLAPLSVRRGVIEDCWSTVHLARREFDVFGGDEGAGSQTSRPRFDRFGRHVGNREGDLARRTER